MILSSDVAEKLFAKRAIVVAKDTDDGEIVWASPYTETLFRIVRSGAIQRMKIEDLVPEQYREAHRKYRIEFYKNPQSRPMGLLRNLVGLRQDGTVFRIRADLEPCYFHGEGDCTLAEIVEVFEPTVIPNPKGGVTQ